MFFHNYSSNLQRKMEKGQSQIGGLTWETQFFLFRIVFSCKSRSAFFFHTFFFLTFLFFFFTFPISTVALKIFPLWRIYTPVGILKNNRKKALTQSHFKKNIGKQFSDSHIGMFWKFQNCRLYSADRIEKICITYTYTAKHWKT